jgi:ribosomal protein L11 methyltransferase
MRAKPLNLPSSLLELYIITPYNQLMPYLTTSHPLPETQQTAALALTEQFDASLDISAANPEVFNSATMDLGDGGLTATWIIDEAQKHAFTEALSALTDTSQLMWTHVREDVDYVAETAKNFPPLIVQQFFIARNNEKIPADKIGLHIPANRAFGSGEHATTTGCLLALQSLSIPGRVFDKVLDVGAGSAILAMAAAKLHPHAHIICTDNDAPSVAIGLENAAVNGVKMDYVADENLTHSTVLNSAPYPLIFANILLQPLQQLAPKLAQLLATGGALVLSGFTDEQGPEIHKTFTAQGLKGLMQATSANWQTRVYVK